jgi:hypothetical protein
VKNQHVLLKPSLCIFTVGTIVTTLSLLPHPWRQYSESLAQFFVPNDTIVSNPNESLSDPEFDQVGFRLTWQDRWGERLQVAPIDRQTGDLLLDQTRIVDTHLAPLTVDKTGSRNGPEWVYGRSGSQVVYTKEMNGKWLLGITQGSGTNLSPGLMPIDKSQTDDDLGATPIGSRNPSDLNPRVVYLFPTQAGLKTMAWRSTQEGVGGSVPIPGGRDCTSIGRWVNNESQALIYAAKTASRLQIFKYEVETQRATQLTTSLTSKSQPFMWRAPEFNYEFIFLALENGGGGYTQLGIYRFLNGAWTRINTLQSPSSFKLIRSPEPFTYNGRSYVSLVFESQKDGPSEIWFASIDPDRPLYRQVSDPTVQAVRRDPEPFMLQTGLVIYYTERTITDKGTTRYLTHRAWSGLEPPPNPSQLPNDPFSSNKGGVLSLQSNATTD